MNDRKQLTERANQLKDWLRRNGYPPRLRTARVDYYHWLTLGQSNQVLWGADQGVAAVSVRKGTVSVETNRIEAERLLNEGLKRSKIGLKKIHEWYRDEKESRLDCDPAQDLRLDMGLRTLRAELSRKEVDRLRALGQDVSRLMTQVLKDARPDWTEWKLAAHLAALCLEHGIEPTLTLCAGDKRRKLWRHPLPTFERLGQSAILVLCARRHGLFVNQTRIVYFGSVPVTVEQRYERLLRVESVILDGISRRKSWQALWRGIHKAYSEWGSGSSWKEHHQGGVTGYLSREAILGANAHENFWSRFEVSSAQTRAFAFNPSFAGGLKVEDTFLLSPQGAIEMLSDPQIWPHQEFGGQLRPRIVSQESLS